MAYLYSKSARILVQAMVIVLISGVPFAALAAEQPGAPTKAALVPGPALQAPGPASPAGLQGGTTDAGVTIVPPRTVPYTEAEFANLPNEEKLKTYHDTPNLLPLNFSPMQYPEFYHSRQ